MNKRPLHLLINEKPDHVQALMPWGASIERVKWLAELAKDDHEVYDWILSATLVETWRYSRMLYTRIRRGNTIQNHFGKPVKWLAPWRCRVNARDDNGNITRTYNSKKEFSRCVKCQYVDIAPRIWGAQRFWDRNYPGENHRYATFESIS